LITKNHYAGHSSLGGVVGWFSWWGALRRYVWRLGLCFNDAAATTTPRLALFIGCQRGRLLSYTAVGALVGGIGGLGIASLNSLGVQWGLFFFAQSLLFLLGLYLAVSMVGWGILNDWVAPSGVAYSH